MIRVLPTGTTYPFTDKDTVIRQAFYRTFQRDIEDVYHEADYKSAGTLVLSELELQE